ncbi:MAG: DUF3526 domain-containing protein [Pseudomonadota bacterium]
MHSAVRELRFAGRDPVVVLTLTVAAFLSSITVFSGLTETSAEQRQIDRVRQMVDEDRAYALKDQSDAGGAAYYGFHFTYDPPSPLTFAARGVRDDLPWKHRIRMLALEGQIYETDTGNPELSRIGKLDFAFVAAFLSPLLLILLLHDLKAGEARNNRWTFLSAVSGDGPGVLRARAILRAGLLFACIIVPFIVAALINFADFTRVLIAIGVVFVNVVFWTGLSLFVAARLTAGPTVAATLLGAWFLLAVAIPVGGKIIIEQGVAVPSGGDLLLTQRDAVNTAWDLPREATMTPFYARHPEWADATPISEGFDWFWYYAFQQVGDQTVEDMSRDLRRGVARRDRAMGLLSVISPPLLVNRALATAAQTDIAAFQSYDQCVRDFHARLRGFHYKMLFGNLPYSSEVMEDLPVFVPCSL